MRRKKDPKKRQRKSKNSPDQLIVGLGNPGNLYKNTRHNLGFELIDKFVDSAVKTTKKRICNSDTNLLSVDGKMILLAKPRTFVNNSGLAVKCLMKNFSISFNQLIVVYDDIDSPKGKIKFKSGGRSGGHNGIESIINEISTTEFKRIKIGVGRPEDDVDPADYVLEKISSEDELKILSEAVLSAKEKILEIILNENQ